MNKKRAIVSVYRKDGLVSFIKKLVKDFNYEIISTGGTQKVLEEAGIETTKVSSLTNFPEILDGRVKTLHPNIHGGILANQNNPEHINVLKKHQIKPIDMVVVNLYPFEEVARKPNVTTDELIENIDIGGPTLLRSAAKNHDSVTTICSSDDYDDVLKEMSNNKGEIDKEYRRKLSVKAFEHTYLYDQTIHKKLSERFNIISAPRDYELELTKVHDLRYGENPHQQAALYRDIKTDKTLPFSILQGKQLSYNNMVDLTAALNIINEFGNQPAACIIKHNNPCGVAVSTDHITAYKKALNADPISAFGGIVGINGTINNDLARFMSTLFLEVIIAYDFTEEALSIFGNKKNLRIITIPKDKCLVDDYVLKQVVGGILIQNRDSKNITKEDLEIVTEEKPTDQQLDDLLFAWKIVKHVTSNAIVIAKNGQTIGIGCGQTSRIGSMEIALRQSCDEAKDAVIASDAFFPNIDNIQAAAQCRIGSIIQPGGSIKDKDVIATANKLGLSMVFSGIRHFKH